LYVIVGCTFFKITKIYESLQVLLLKKTLSNLNKLVNAYIAISASRCGRVVNGFHYGPRTQNHKPDLGTKAKLT